MSIIKTYNMPVDAQVMDLITRERSKALSRREWKHRLAGYGYSVRETDAGDVVETLRTRAKVCVLSAHIAA